MAFTRTTSGLRNQHLFHRVDIIVYVEGGTSFSISDILRGSYSNESIDSLFWNQIFIKHSRKSVKFKPIGSKASVLKIAKKIVDDGLETIYAAMDQEFDMVYGLNLEHKNILYTYGYSWENDVWNEDVICKVIDTLSANKIDKNIVSNYYSKFLKEIKFSVSVDGYLFGKSSSFFPRPRGYMRFVECDLNNETCVKKHELESVFIGKGLKKSTIYGFGRRKGISSERNCYGHLLGDFCSKLIQFLLNKYYSLKGIKAEFIRRMAIINFLNRTSLDVKNHYSTSVS